MIIVDRRPNPKGKSLGNRRLDPGEDTNGNGLLDLGGQTYALVVAGPVYLAEAAPSKGPTGFPQSSITLDKVEQMNPAATQHRPPAWRRRLDA